MPGIIGAVSPKIAFIAAMLAFQAQVGAHRLNTVIDPTSESSHMSRSLAADVQPGRLRVGIAGEFSQPLAIDMLDGPAGRSELVLGRDFLFDNSVDVDLRRNRILLLERKSYPVSTGNKKPVPLGIGEDGLTVLGRPFRWNSYIGQDVVLDLPHHTLWIARTFHPVLTAK